MNRIMTSLLLVLLSLSFWQPSAHAVTGADSCVRAITAVAGDALTHQQMQSPELHQDEWGCGYDYAVDAGVAPNGSGATNAARINNPHPNAHGFSARNVNAVGGTNNCASCSIAMDSTLGGLPASALIRGVTLVSDVEGYFGSSFMRGMTPQSITSSLTEAGSGSRGIVFGSRGSGRVGHFFNVVNQKGAVRFIDAQTGTAANLEGFTDFWFLPTK